MLDERAGRLSLLLMVVAIALMATAMWSSSWLIAEYPSAELKIGIWSVEQCGGDDCRVIELDAYVRDHSDSEPIAALVRSSWGTLGIITLVFGAIAVVALIAAWKVHQPPTSMPSLVAKAAAPRVSRLPAISAVAHLLAIGSAVVLVGFTAPDTDVVAGHAFTMFLVGAVSGLIASAALWPVAQPPAPASGST